MSERNSTRSGCKDVFHAFLVKNAVYDTKYEIPCLARETQTPTKLIAFSKAIASKEYDSWIHFYEDDAAFERIWNKPNMYLPIIKKFTLGEFLSSANPFLFDNLSSAVPEIYDNFASYITEPITVENSYDKALNYVNSLHNDIITKAFKNISKEEWIGATLDYLSHDHKGDVR